MRIVAALALATAGLARALVGDWTSYTPLEEIRDLEVAKGHLFAATGGGIRKIAAAGTETVYRNTEGLLDVDIQALAAGPEGEIYASSRLGLIYRYASASDRWEILTTSYKGTSWIMRERALVCRDGFLVIGSEKGLSFFNLKKRVAEANVTKMAAASGISVNGLLFDGDTLYAGTNKGIFRTVLHLGKLMTDPDVNIFNPGIWSQIPGTGNVRFFHPEFVAADPVPLIDSATGDTIGMDPGPLDTLPPWAVTEESMSHGFLYLGEKGISSDYEGDAWREPAARISRYGQVRVSGNVFPGFHPGPETIAYFNGAWYIGTMNKLYRFFPNGETGEYQTISNTESLPSESYTAIAADRHGVYAKAALNAYKLRGSRWTILEGFDFFSNAEESKVRGQHALNVLGPDELAFGTWGQGFYTFRGGVQAGFKSKNSCVGSALPSEDYPVIWSQTPYRDKGIWMSSYMVLDKYRLSYYDFGTGTIECIPVNSGAREPRNIQVVGDSVLVVVTEAGLEAFRISDNGGLVSLEPRNLLVKVPAVPEGLLAGKADRNGNFWVTTGGSGLMFVPEIIFHPDSVNVLRTLEGAVATGCKSLDIDPAGHLWAGCTPSGGVIEITPGRDSLSHVFRRYGLNDGLLSESVYHLSVNQDNGEIWMATEKGLARYQSASRPAKPDFSELKVYPNPFLPKHAAVVFDNLASGSKLQVMTQSGSVVYQKSMTSGTGNQFLWDGRNQGGQRVREGVYFYVVRSPKETRHGKIIVAR